LLLGPDFRQFLDTVPQLPAEVDTDLRLLGKKVGRALGSQHDFG
jgi:hypothetical protein